MRPLSPHPRPKALRGRSPQSIATAVVVAPSAGAPASGPFDRDDRKVLMQYARDTYRSMEAMVEPETGLVDDNIEGSLDPATRGGYTSPTNIGAWLWSTVVARELHFISRSEARQRMALTLETLAQLERHPQSGMFYNWYDPATLEKLRVWPENGSTVYPFLSSVDNGWLAAAFMVVRSAEPRLRDEAEALLYSMDFGFFYDPLAKGPDVPAGLMRGGFWDEPPPDCGVLGNYRGGGPDVWYTCHHYGALNSETRAISYIAIALGQVPPEHYFAIWRTFPPTCDWSWQEQLPVGEWEEHLGVPVFQGAYQYRGVQLVPSFGGDMFEALMPDLFVPECAVGAGELGTQPPAAGVGADRARAWSRRTTATGASRRRAIRSAATGSTASRSIGMSTDGYASDVERTNVDVGFGDCRAGPADARVRRRCRDTARRVPRPAVRARRGDGQPGEHQGRLRRLRAGRLLRRHRRRHRPRRPSPPVARPGDDHGRARQRLRPRRAAQVRSLVGEVRRTLPQLLAIEEFNVSTSVPPIAAS